MVAGSPRPGLARAAVTSRPVPARHRALPPLPPHAGTGLSGRAPRVHGTGGAAPEGTGSTPCSAAADLAGQKRRRALPEARCPASPAHWSGRPAPSRLLPGSRRGDPRGAVALVTCDPPALPVPGAEPAPHVCTARPAAQRPPPPLGAATRPLVSRPPRPLSVDWLAAAVSRS